MMWGIGFCEQTKESGLTFYAIFSEYKFTNYLYLVDFQVRLRK